MSNIKKYQKIFCNIFDVQEDDLNADFTFSKIGKWDSVAHMSLISALEDEFDILFDTEDILSFGSFENGQKILTKYGVKF